MIQAKDVLRLTGLSADQLREWTTRRRLIVPDVSPAGRGTLALYSWQTVLLLRLAVQLRETFKMELQGRRALFMDLSAHLAGISFPSLWGCRLALYGDDSWEILTHRQTPSPQKDALTVRLDPHLQVLSAAFDPQVPMQQLPLFPAVKVR